MKTCVMTLTVVMMVAVMFSSTTASASPSLGNGYTLPDGSAFNWNVANSDFGRADVWFNVQLQHPELDTANWEFSVNSVNTDLWTAQLFISGPLNNSVLSPGAPLNVNSSVSRGGVSMNNNLFLGYWTNNGSNPIMMLGGNLNLSPARIDNSSFQVNEFGTWSWDGAKMVQSPTPNYWTGNLSLSGHFLDTGNTPGVELGALYLGAPTPEPATLALLAMGSIAAAIRRRMH